MSPEHTGGIHNARPAGQYRIGKVRKVLELEVDKFRGVRNVASLAVYPIVHHPSASTLKHTLATRGKQWRDLCEGGIQLVKFTGLEARLTFIHYPDPAREFLSECSQVEQSDVVLDHRGYFAMNPQAKIPLGEHIKAAEGRGPQDKVCDDDWLLAPTIVYGYSVSERQWAAYDVSGDFKKHPKDSAVLSDGNFAPAVACRDAPLLDIIRNHARANSISKSVVGEDAQGLLLILYGFTARTKAEDIARAYEQLGRPRYTFSFSRLAAMPSEIDSFRTAIASNAVLVIHKDPRDALYARVMSLHPRQHGGPGMDPLLSLMGQGRKCIVLLVISQRDVELEHNLHAGSNFSVHSVGFYIWLTFGWWVASYYWLRFRVQCML
ncbi:hypothetical protein K466DRAFT_590048 [Polyporus arcularius HHB13444]|uniref:Uncharacterized protein n=1 Tax=Polyporus arcularius HHB13444 TaxID=1314778 RepID=A0A5C3P421_9APHY|nr:hypothetical protein K466DRAFT_590048 [Polyporus arcularius HHB13444]